MAQFTASLYSFDKTPVLCCYYNSTNHVQVIRITNIQSWYFERVVFPQEKLLFSAPVEAQLEIYQGGLNGVVILWDKINCDRLQVREEVETPLETAKVS